MNLHHTASRIEFDPTVAITAGLRASRGVKLMGVAPDRPIRLRWNAIDRPASAFRVTLGIDDRTFQTSLLHVHDLATGERVGTIDMRFSGAFKIQSLPLSPSVARALQKDGAELRLENAGHLHLIESLEEDSPVLRPHLLCDDAHPSPADAYLELMKTPAVRHPFGWLVGCVMDGQAELHRLFPAAGYDAALQSIFIDDFFRDGGMHSEIPGAKPLDGDYYGIEATLPVAQLARLHPTHPAIDKAIEFWLSRQKPDGNIRDHGTSTEGCYTIAWPMAMVAKVRNRDDLRTIAIQQCLHRQRINLHDGVWQIVTESGERKLRNWCRGVAWYLLGSIRTMIPTGITNDAILASLTDVIDRLPVLQDGGVWNNFIDDPDSAIDCSGSAGIAAAIALGTEAGLLPSKYRPIATRATHGLISHLTPDGLLQNCAQENKGGESLQRSTYRVISQMGMGLLAQAWQSIR